MKVYLYINKYRPMDRIDNGLLSIAVSAHGAELTGIRKGDTEYLWNADPRYWDRSSPVLFPMVGRVWENRYRVGEREFGMGQHGFARDREFTLIYKDGESLLYRLSSDEESRKIYPWDFVLEIGYRLKGNSIEVSWKVINHSPTAMWFQIGAHPAFNYPDFDPERQERGFFAFDGKSELLSAKLARKGCVEKGARFPVPLDSEGRLVLERNTFDGVDTYVLEDSQVSRVDMLRPDGRPWLSVHFDAPLVGLWSPPEKNAPFVCIEPWYGRCDWDGFEGDISEREWVWKLEAGESFEAGYSIDIY